MVRDSDSGSPAMPCEFMAIADTVTCLSGAWVPLSTEVSVAKSVVSICSADIANTVPARAKSSSTAGLTGVAETVTVVCSLDGWLSVAVTVASPPSSPIKSSDRMSFTVGGSSSSSMVSGTPVGCSTPWSFDAVAFSVSTLFGAWMLLSTAVKVTGAETPVAPARIVRVPESLSEKSPGDGVRVMVVVWLDGCCCLTVTVVMC